MRVCFGCNAMAQVEHMTATLAVTRQAHFHLVFDDGRIRQHNGWIKIALQGHSITHPGSCIGKRDRPVHTEAIAAGSSDGFEMRIAALAKQDHRDGPAIV